MLRRINSDLITMELNVSRETHKESTRRFNINCFNACNLRYAKLTNKRRTTEKNFGKLDVSLNGKNFNPILNLAC